MRISSASYLNAFLNDRKSIESTSIFPDVNKRKVSGSGLSRRVVTRGLMRLGRMQREYKEFQTRTNVYFVRSIRNEIGIMACDRDPICFEAD